MSDKNAAIVVAVSEYSRTSRLPACKNDGQLVRDILRETGRFEPDNIFFAHADADTVSSKLKADLPRFIDHLAKTHKTLDEVFFYFSGHGHFDGNDFYYVLSDFDQKKLNQTCLSNSELDGMLRALSPGLAVKVVDACESGTSYIKTPEEIYKALGRSEQGFKNCYFMYSSEQDQTSGLDDRLSYFTRAFARSLLDYENRTIRYQDIIANIRDQFSGRSGQRPFFVTQAGHTEAFAEVSAPLAALLKSKSSWLTDEVETQVGAGMGMSITGAAPTTTTTTPPPALSLIDRLRQRIEEAERKHCTEEEANKVYEAIRQAIEAGSYPELLRSFFDIEVAFVKDSYDILPSAVQIAKWFEQEKGDHFVELEYREVQDDTFMFPRGGIFGSGKRSVLSGFHSTVKDPPFRCVKITAKPKLLSLPMWSCYIAFTVSKTEMRTFYAFSRYKDKNWNERGELFSIQWKTTGFPLKEISKSKPFVDQVLAEFAKTVETDLMEKYKLAKG
jgi:hypothetical protein